MGFERHKAAVVSSALWAAVGDAVGWMTELTDLDGVKHRTGSSTVSGLVSWRRKVFGRGPVVDLPAGTYSDDTQLRLAVCRATRASGQFDVEAFAKIELPVWLSYSLGAGRGSTAAATNLCKPSVNWFSNYYDAGERGYFAAGGNGAAMRIQPHVWKAAPNQKPVFLLDVLKDSVTTHGHAHGFCGAIFHALCVSYALDNGSVPAPEFWCHAAHTFGEVEDLIQSDRQLRNIWLPAWQDRNRRPLTGVLAETIQEAIHAINAISNISGERPESAYRKMLGMLDLRNESLRGSGLLTAIAAAALAWQFRDESTESALLMAANELHTDTDTIATMAGAIIGAARPGDGPEWSVQDANYIVAEASRMADISSGLDVTSFTYPDLLHWSPPDTQADAVVQIDGGLALRGLGRLSPLKPEVKLGAFLWQWMELDYGQTVLAKRRVEDVPMGVRNWLPTERLRQSKTHHRVDSDAIIQDVPQPLLPLPQQEERVFVQRGRVERGGVPAKHLTETGVGNLDRLTQEAIRSGFEPSVIGRTILEAIRSGGSIEGAVAYAAILAKAVLTRERR